MKEAWRDRGRRMSRRFGLSRGVGGAWPGRRALARVGEATAGEVRDAEELNFFAFARKNDAEC